MVNPLNPDNVKGWIGLSLSVVERATPITLFFMLLTGGIMGFYLLKELGRTRTMNTALWERLILSEKQTIELAWRCTTGGEKR